MKLAVTAVAGLLCQPVSAADKPYPRLRWTVSEYARCVVRFRPDEARDYVLRNARIPIYGECLGFLHSADAPGRMTFPGENYRYVLADALFRVDYPAGLDVDTSRVPALPPLDELSFSGGSRKEAAKPESRVRYLKYRTYRQFGECVARANPAGAVRLARTKVDTPDEQSALNDLSPDFSRCGTATAMGPSIVEIVRGAVVLTTYMLHQAASPQLKTIANSAFQPHVGSDNAEA